LRHCHAYEEKHYPIPDVPGYESLLYLMEEHDLSPADFQEIGTVEELKAILEGKKELSVNQIRLLADRFHVSPSIFI